MIVLFAIVTWIFSLALVTGLCLAARRGDLQPQGEPLAEPAGDPIELFVLFGEAGPANTAARDAVSSRICQPAARRTSEPPARQAGNAGLTAGDFLSRHGEAPGDLALQPG